MRNGIAAGFAAIALVALGCSTPARSPSIEGSAPAAPSASLPPTAAALGASPVAGQSATARVVHDGLAPVVTGTPIDIDDLDGRIVFDDFEDVIAMDVGGSNVVRIASDPTGAEFDGAWAPDGEWVVYRDSTRGINVDDELFIARADGTGKRNLTRNPANDWGPDWSPDGSTIVFNSDRDGGAIRGYTIDVDGSNLRRLPIEGWVEYPSFSPDGSRIVYEGAVGSNYEVFVADIETGKRTQLTRAPGNDGWPVWSPDGSTIAFTSERDDCEFAPPDQECWTTGEPGEHRSIYLVDPDGSNLRRVMTDHGQFLAWSPDGEYLLVSGHSLHVIRPDGTGRLELRAAGIALPLGGIPDWVASSGADDR
jgi:Tol biopolymer transport system component